MRLPRFLAERRAVNTVGRLPAVIDTPAPPPVRLPIMQQQAMEEAQRRAAEMAIAEAQGAANSGVAYSATERLPIVVDPAVGMIEERPRVIGDPNEAAYGSASGARAARMQALLTDPVTDRNGRLRSGAKALIGRPLQPTDSLGNMGGQLIGRFLSGVISPEQDEEQERQRDLQREVTAQKVETEQEEHDVNIAGKKADIAYKEKLPGIKTKEQESRALDQRRRALASQFNRVDDFDPDDPANADFVAEAREVGLPVFAKKKGEKGTYKQDAKTGAWYVFRGDKSDTVKAPASEGQLSTTTPQAMSAEQQAENRKSREKIAAMLNNSRESIAAQNRAIQEERVKLSKDQFAAKYPGVGKIISAESLAEKAKRLNVLPEELVKDAIAQGYTIQ